MAVPSPVGEVEIVWRARMVQCLEHAPPTSVAEFESRGQRHMRDEFVASFRVYASYNLYFLQYFFAIYIVLTHLLQ